VWRRVTTKAVILQVVICLVIYAGLPTFFSEMPWATHNPAFLAETAPRTVMVEARAGAQDVVAGRARAEGDTIRKPEQIAPVAVFFDRVAHEVPARADSPKVGLGRFNAEVWLLSLVGFDFSHSSKAGLAAARFFFDAAFPFVLLALFSFVTRPVPREILDRFFARLHTPVQPTPELDTAAVAAAYANPAQYDGEKLFPSPQWEILKPSMGDFIGFFGTWALVGLVVFLLWAMVTVQ